MSGRLIILPKKSYCPWNSSNVKRVLRDERQHAEAQEREKSLRDQESSRTRLKTLRQGKAHLGEAAAEEGPDKSDVAQHANLFAVEEEAYRKRVENATAIDFRGKGKPPNRGIMPLYLGQSAQADSFYLQAGASYLSKYQGKDLNPKEIRLKNGMDPMKEFVRDEPTAEVLIPSNEFSKELATAKSASIRRKHKHRRRSSKQSSDSSSSSDWSSSDSTSEDEDSNELRRRRRKSRKLSSRKRCDQERQTKADILKIHSKSYEDDVQRERKRNVIGKTECLLVPDLATTPDIKISIIPG